MLNITLVAGEFLFYFLSLNKTQRHNMFTIFSYDSLILYDGDSNSSPILGKYCGTSIPPSHISSSNMIYIHFHSDGSIEGLLEYDYTGFKLEYHLSGKKYSYFGHTIVACRGANSPAILIPWGFGESGNGKLSFLGDQGN